MFSLSKMRTVKGRGVGDEAVIGELVEYNCGRLYTGKAQIALICKEVCDFDTLFEVSFAFMGFICVGEYDKGVAEIAEELRLVGLFSDDEKRLLGALNEKVIILPQKSRAILAPDVKELAGFERAMLAQSSLFGVSKRGKQGVLGHR